MDVSKISGIDQQAISRAIEYWVEHWDWECPTLFGIELDELKQVLHCWPSTVVADQPRTDAAALGALRELLYGASSLPKAEVQEAIGISYDQAEELIEKIATADRTGSE